MGTRCLLVRRICRMGIRPRPAGEYRTFFTGLLEIANTIWIWQPSFHSCRTLLASHWPRGSYHAYIAILMMVRPPGAALAAPVHRTGASACIMKSLAGLALPWGEK